MAAKNRLKQIRHEMYIDTGKEMAKLLGISQGQYNRYERNEIQPNIEICIKIAKKLNKTVEDIWYIEDPAE